MRHVENVMRLAARPALTVLGGAALLLACATPAKHTENLVDTSYRYQEGLRWQRFDDAAVFVPPEEREDFLDERDQLAEDLRIDDYEVTRVKLRRQQSEAIVQVKYTWHLDSVGVVHETTTEQAWQRKGVRWVIVSEVRKHGPAMPGVAEPPKKMR
jgi:hypothetical protein